MKAAVEIPDVRQPDHRAPRPLLRWCAVALSLAGWWLSWDLARLSFDGEAVTPWLQRECGGTAEAEAAEGDFDCQSVLNSRWASVPISRNPNASRIPTAVFGMGYFAFAGLWYLFVGPPTRSRWARHLLITALVFVGVLLSLGMIEVMREELHKWCGGCLVVHGINGVLFLLTIAAFPWRADAENRAPHPRGRLALAALGACSFLFLLHLSVALLLIANSNSKRLYDEYIAIVDDPEFVRWNYQRQPIEPLVTDLPPDVGRADAPNHLVIFTDPQCSACRVAHETLKIIQARYPDQLRISYVHFPMDSACNPAFPRGGHPAACRGARAIEAARGVGGAGAALAMLDLCHKRLEELDSADFAVWAAELNLDARRFDDALNSLETEAKVRADIALGERLGIRALPVLYLNGRRLHHWRKAETFTALLINVETRANSATLDSPAAREPE